MKDHDLNSSSLTKASYIIKINHTAPKIDNVDPRELTKFHKEKLSGKSEYLLGIPDKPKKCCGKNVKLTPTKVTQKCILP